MPENIYEIVSLGMRYWFAFLGLLIVWRAFSWLRKDRRAKHRRLKHLPDAGMIGEMAVLQGSDELPEGTVIPVPRAGVLGFVRTCDVVVPVDGVAARHVDFVFQDGKGLLLFPLRKQRCIVDDTELTHRSKTKKHPMCHGSHLQVGDAVLRLRLFAGLDTAYRPTYAPYQPEPQPWWPEQYPEENQPAPWQNDPYVYQQNPAPYQQPANPWQQEEQPVYEEQPQEASWLNPPVYQPWQPPQQEVFPPAQPRQQGRRRRRYHEE
ncbi:MAG: hypothetical protein J6M20_01915 [Clostridia bacterium]|nr:hypothetical protein [Clostridia bacterium]